MPLHLLFLLIVHALPCEAPVASVAELADAAQLAKLEKEMQGPELVVTVDLHLGTFAASIYTCDFSLDYVHINADYTT